MKALLTLIQPAFDWTWKNSLQVALLVGLVLLVQTVLARWLTPRLRYALSLLILLRLLLPAVPSSPLSLENLFRPVARLEAHSRAPERGHLGEASLPDGPISPMVTEPAPVAPTAPLPVVTPFVSAPPSRPPDLSVAEVLGLVWACGLLALVSLAGWRYGQWCGLIRQGRRLSDPRLLALLDDAREAMGVRRPVSLVVVAQLTSPAVFGFRQIRLLLPDAVLDQLTDQDLRLLFLHEMAHVRRYDMLLNLLLMAVQFVHWFNPLVWLGLHRLRADRELVCDAMVLQRTRPEERSGYGLLLLKLLTDFPAEQGIIPTAVPVVTSQSELKRRIVLIKHHRRPALAACVTTAVLAVGLACATFTRASQHRKDTIALSFDNYKVGEDGLVRAFFAATNSGQLVVLFKAQNASKITEGDWSGAICTVPAHSSRTVGYPVHQTGLPWHLTVNCWLWRSSIPPWDTPSGGSKVYELVNSRKPDFSVRGPRVSPSAPVQKRHGQSSIRETNQGTQKRNAAESPGTVPQTTHDVHGQVAEPPTLRFLSWRHEWQTNQPAAAWHPDGSPVTDSTELDWLRQVKPADPEPNLIQWVAQMHAASKILKPRILYLWFSCLSRTPVGFDQLSLLDGADRGIPSLAPSPAGTDWQEPSDRNGHLGWSTASLLTMDALNVPPRVTVRLDYTGGPLERVKEVAITPSLETPIPVDDGAAVKGYGQDAKERAFIAIAVDGEKIWSRRFDVIAVTTDGGEVTSSSRPFGGTAKPTSGVVKFEFELPLAKVAKFRIGSRPIRTRQWSNVVMTGSTQNLYGDTQSDRSKSSTAAIERGRESAAVLQALVQAILTGDSAGLEKEGLGFKVQPENSQGVMDFRKQMIRWQAATALTKRGTNAWPAVPALLSTVSGKDMSVGLAAAEALFGIKAEESPEWARSRQMLTGQTNAARVFRYLLVGRDMFGRTYDAAHRRFGLVGLAATGPAAGIAYPDIVDVLKHDKELEVRACAAMVLGSLEVERKATVVLLKGVLQDKEEWPLVSAAAAKALVTAAPAEAETRDLFRQALQDPRSAVRLAAARALWRMKAPAEEVLPVLTALSNHKLASTRAGALNGLSEMGSAARPSVPEVQRLTSDENESVRRAAAEALNNITGPALGGPAS